MGVYAARIVRRFSRSTAIVCLLLAAFACWRAFRVWVGVPALGRTEGYSTPVYDRTGLRLRDLPSRTGTRGQPVPLTQVSPRFLLSIQVSEDRHFRAHDGVDRGALLRALAQNLAHGRRVSGASTLTQQLVKNLDGAAQRRTFGQKLWEMAAAQNLEAAHSKDEILESYVNHLGFGHGLVGIDAAARGYFGVPPASLSWGEAAFLAVLPRAPSRLDPYRHPERVRSRQRVLLRQLHAEGLLGAAELETALGEPLTIHPLAAAPRRGRFVVAALRARPAAKAASSAVHLTLDSSLQADAQAELAEMLLALRPFHASGVAAVVVDNATSEVLAWASASEAEASHVDLVLARHSPGSLLKPFVYGLAFQQGLPADALLVDAPMAIGGRDGTYAPQNFDGTSRGLVPARSALAESLNLPVLRLAQELTLGRVAWFLERVGLPPMTPAREGLPLVLGSASVSLAELAVAYGTLARGGIHAPLRFEAQAPRSWERRMSSRAAAQVTSVLADARLRLPLLHGALDVPFSVALKTGTSAGFHDAWAVLYTPQRTVAVWVGNPSGGPMAPGATGGRLAVPIATRLLLRSTNRLPAPRAAAPIAVQPRAIDLTPRAAVADVAPLVRVVEPAMGAVVSRPSLGAEPGVHVRLALPPGVSRAVVVLDGRRRFPVGPSGRAFLPAELGEHELVAYVRESGAPASVRFALR